MNVFADQKGADKVNIAYLRSNEFLVLPIQEKAVKIVSSKEIGVKDKIMELCSLFVGARSAKDKDFVAKQLSGQIDYLSKFESHMNASEKIKVLLEIPPEVALNDVNPAVFQSIVKAYSEQTNYLKNKAQLIQTAAAFADAYQLWYPLGQPSLGFIKENVKFDPGNSSILKLEMESGRIKEDLDPKIIPDNIFQCAKEYYEFQIMTAHELGEQESKAKNPNQTILDLINSISSNASDHLYELEKIMSKGKTPETKMQAVKGLINFKTGHYEPAMQKIGEEKYWDQLYSIQGGSDYKKTLVFLHQHAHTGALWSAFGLSCLNPIAGQLAFGVMGAKGVAEGISSGSAQQILFGLAMMSGMSRNPYISTTATAYMNADILTTSARQILTGMNTSFTPTDVESLSNNAVLLAGYFKSKPSNNDWTSKQQKKTGINAQVIIKETREKEAERPNRETPKGLENSKSNLGKDAGLIEELAKKGISLQAGEIEYLSMNGLTREKTEILMRSSNPKNLLYDLLLLSPEALRCYSNLIGRVGKIPAVSVSKNKSLAEELSQGRIPMVDLVSREGVTQFSKAFSYLHAIEELSGPLIQNSSKPVVLIVPLRGSYFPTRTAQLILSNARKSGAVSEIQLVSSPSNGKNFKMEVERLAEKWGERGGANFIILDEVSSGASLQYAYKNIRGVFGKRTEINNINVSIVGLTDNINGMILTATKNNPELYLSLFRDGTLRFESEIMQNEIEKLNLKDREAVGKFTDEFGKRLRKTSVIVNFPQLLSHEELPIFAHSKELAEQIRNSPPNISIRFGNMLEMFSMDNEFLLYDQQAGKYPVSSYDPARFNYQQELYSLFQLILDAKGKQ